MKMKNYEDEIKKRVTEINTLFGKQLLSNLTYDDLRIYMKEGKKKVNGKFIKQKFPYVVINIPRIDKFVGGTTDRYKVGHRIVVPFTTHNSNDFNIKNKDVLEKVMNKVKEHGQKYFLMKEDEFNNPK